MSALDGERRERGLRLFGAVMTFPAPAQDDSPSTAALLDFVFAEVWSRPALSRRDRRFITLACVAGAGAETALRDHVYAALNSGDITITEMREAVLQFAVYAGWPKASRFEAEVDQQWERIDTASAVITPPPQPALPPGDSPAVGEQSFRTLNCVSFVPSRDNPYTGAILDFVYGEVWLRPGLGVRERRLVTLVCAAFQDVALPIVSHVYAALKSRDISFEEMDELALHFAAYYGWPKASHLNTVIAEQQQRVLAEWRDEGG